jgi:hypothetical protein
MVVVIVVVRNSAVGCGCDAVPGATAAVYKPTRESGGSVDSYSAVQYK